MRGKAAFQFAPACNFGITPAYAGKRETCPQIVPQSLDHPRLCGEKLFSVFAVAVCSGSPPPMRGKDVSQNFHMAIFGITPAYAGKSFTGGLNLTLTRGSPPPMRGKASLYNFPFPPFGITPAYAGKSPEIATVMVQPQDHPRLCGEKFPTISSTNDHKRITPAYAGKRDFPRIE